MQKNFFIPMAIGLLLVLLVGAVVLRMGNKKENQVVLKNEPQEKKEYTEVKIETQHEESEEFIDWEVYENSRAGYVFKYPAKNLTIPLSDASDQNSGNSGPVDFAVGRIVFGVHAYIGVKEDTVESWIQGAFASADHDLSMYEKTTVDGRTAYRMSDKAYVYVLANGNIYNITAYNHVIPAKIADEPLFEKWVSTIHFIE